MKVALASAAFRAFNFFLRLFAHARPGRLNRDGSEKRWSSATSALMVRPRVAREKARQSHLFAPSKFNAHAFPIFLPSSRRSDRGTGMWTERDVDHDATDIERCAARTPSPDPSALGQHDAHSFNCVAFPRQYLEVRVLAIAPKTDGEAPLPQPQIGKRYVRQPVRQCRINIQFVARRILLQPQHRLQQHERCPRSPGLWHVGTEILHWKACGITLQPSIELR